MFFKDSSGCLWTEVGMTSVEREMGWVVVVLVQGAMPAWTLLAGFCVRVARAQTGLR